jgi:DnaK suppressor protein
MEASKARDLLASERQRTERLLGDLAGAGEADRTAANQTWDMFDSAEPLVTEGGDDAVREELLRHLAAIDRAEQRLGTGTYGLSVRSWLPIPDDRLEADPTAELTVDEARQPE